MKRILAFALVLAVAASGIAFAEIKAKDGVYFAQGNEFSKSGWKEQVVVTVKGGKIVDVKWNGVSNLPGATDKKAWAAAGKYGMNKVSKVGEWDKQAAAAEAWLVKTQDVGFNKFNKDGKTDAIAGATMTTSEFLGLVNKALASAPVPKGSYKDGWYYAEQKDFDKNSGWKDTVILTVANGTVVDMVWNGIYKDGSKKSKLVESVEGRYGMAKAAKKGEWHLQAAAAQAAVVKAGDPSKIALKPDTTSEAVSGASIHLSGIVLAVEALKGAK